MNSRQGNEHSNLRRRGAAVAQRFIVIAVPGKPKDHLIVGENETYPAIYVPVSRPMTREECEKWADANLR